MFKIKSGYKTLVTVGMILLLCLLVVLFTRLYDLSRDNLLTNESLKIGQEVKDLDLILQKYVMELDLASDTVDKMLERGSTLQEIDSYMEFETETAMPIFDENNTGLYGLIRGEMVFGMDWVPGEDYVPQTRPWYAAAISAKGQSVLVDPYYDANTGLFIISVSKMLSDGENVVSFDVSLNQMQQQSEKLSQVIGMDMLVVTETGLIASSSLKDEIGNYLSDSDQELLPALNIVITNNKDDSFEFSFDGNSYTVFNNEMYGGWRTIAFRSTEGLYNNLNYMYVAAFAVIIFALSYAGIVVLFTNRRRKKAEDISKQLESIADIYVSMYKFDISKGTFEERRPDPFVGSLAQKSSLKPQQIVEIILKKLTEGIEPKPGEHLFDLSQHLIKLGTSDVLTTETKTVNGWVRFRYIVIERKGTSVKSLLWLSENIDAEKKREEELRREAIFDELTGLYNRRAYEHKLRSYNEEEPEDNIVCVAMDVNGLKETNDSLGHAAGDELLKGAAECMKQCFGSYGSLYRTGGDEFVGLIFAEKEKVERLIEDFIDIISQWKGVLVKELSVSFAYASRRDYPELTVSELTNIADDKMYDYKDEYYLSRGIERRRGIK